MMKALEIEPRPCVCCLTPTRFVRDVRGPKGGRKGWEPCCPDCGERGRAAGEPQPQLEAAAA